MAKISEIDTMYKRYKEEGGELDYLDFIIEYGL